MKLRSLPSGIALLTILTTVAGQGGAAAAANASAEPAEISTTVLGLEALEGAPDNVALEITEALRQRVAATKGYQLVAGKDLVEVKLVFSCPDEAPACMSQAGKSMGCAKLIFGNVKRSGADYQITLKLLDVNRGTVEAWASDTVSRRRADAAAFKSLAPAWLAKLTGKGTGGSLQIRANVAGAAVSLDGTRVGFTGSDPVVIADVAPGHHEVAVEKSGYTNTKQEFTLASGQSLPLSLALSAVSVDVGAAGAGEGAPLLVRRPSDAPESPGPQDNTHTMARAGFWVAVVGTLLSAGIGVKYATDVNRINSDLDQYRRFNCSNSDSGLCNAQGLAKPALTDMEKRTVASKTDQGNHAETLEKVFLIGAVPFAIAGGFLLYRGYLDSDTGGASSASRSGHGLRIFPTASASAGGIVTEFDF
jgi:hypothetical protein